MLLAGSIPCRGPAGISCQSTSACFHGAILYPTRCVASSDAVARGWLVSHLPDHRIRGAKLMGFDVQGLRFLLGAHRRGVRFQNTAMIGRQELHLDVISLTRMLGASGISKDRVIARRLLTQAEGFAEPLLELLGAQRICSIDASAYEGASVLHDMNLPIPEGFKQSFSLVIDAGSLEHVFNFPTAIKNCMEMVAEGGHLLLMTPANNFMGHGFYQFSPELFFRIFSGRNGFEVDRVIVCETSPKASWYEVMDPAQAGRRVELTTIRPTYLMVQARRVRLNAIFTEAPQQSDYTALWKENLTKTPTRPLGSVLPFPERVVRGIARRLYAGFRMAEPAALASRRFRPDVEVFTKVSWLS
jgi:SAM-dependent methyltransferase